MFQWAYLPILAYHYLDLPFFCVFGYVSGNLKCLSLWFQRCLIGNYIFQDELPTILMKFLSITLSKLWFIYFSSSLRNKHRDYSLVIQIHLRFISMPSIVRRNNTHFLNGDYDQKIKTLSLGKDMIQHPCKFLLCVFWRTDFGSWCECVDSRIQQLQQLCVLLLPALLHLGCYFWQDYIWRAFVKRL